MLRNMKGHFKFDPPYPSIYRRWLLCNDIWSIQFLNNENENKMNRRHHGWYQVFRSPFCVQVSWSSAVVSVCHCDHLCKYENPLNHKLSSIHFHHIYGQQFLYSEVHIAQASSLGLRDEIIAELPLAVFCLHCRTWGMFSVYVYSGAFHWQASCSWPQGFRKEVSNIKRFLKVPLWHQPVCRPD